MDKVSAIITTYRRDKDVLLRAYNSIYNQSYPNMEIIIVDDNGKNSDFQKANEELFKNEDVKYYALENNSGAQVARNKGLELASGEFVGFLDDDDEWLHDKIDNQVRAFLADDKKEVGLVYCWYRRVKNLDNLKSIDLVKAPEYPNEEVLINLIRKNYIGSTSFPLLRKNVFNQVGHFDESLEASQDYDMWLRISEKFSVKCVNKPLVNYHIHGDERITKNNAKKARAEITFLLKHFDLIISDAKAMGTKLNQIGIYLMRSGKKKAARKYLSYAFSYTPTNIRLVKYYLESLL